MALKKSNKKQSLSWIEISTDNLSANVDSFHNLSPQQKMIAVVKGNAYGHGLDIVGKFLDNHQYVDYLATADLDEALALRKLGIKKPIIVLSFYDHTDLQKIITASRQNIALPIYNFTQLKALQSLPIKPHHPLQLHFKVDVGTHRLGWQEQNYLTAIDEILLSSNLQLVGLFSHLADSESSDLEFTKKQIQEFDRLTKNITDKYNLDLLTHLACSASTMANLATNTTAIRIGIGLYGLNPSLPAQTRVEKIAPEFNLLPILKWKTRVISLQSVKAGDYIGYDKNFQAFQDIEIATLPVGYWDGYNRRLSNQGQVIIKNKACPIVGNVCMNLIMVDVSSIPDIIIGEEALLIAENSTITADHLAELCETINYEIVTNLNSKITRIINNAS